jgi:four helix bundle protein
MGWLGFLTLYFTNLALSVMKTYAFENLDVWQCSRKLAVFIYKITKGFPKEERFGMISQMRRAAVSVSSNLAEGSAKHTAKEKARFTEISFGSLMELLNQGILSYELEFISLENYSEMRTRVNEIAVKSSRLRESQLKMK